MNIAYRTPFTQLPNSVIRSKKLKPAHKVVLSVLCSYANESNIAFPSYQTIADDSGISRRKAIDIIGDLVELGCIRKIEQKSSKGDNTANDYEVLIGGADFALPGEIPAPPRSEYPALLGANSAPNQYINNNINNSFNNNHQSISGCDADEMEEIIKENIEYDILVHTYSKEKLDELVGIMTDAICSTKATIRISGNEFPRECVKSRLMKLNSEQIGYVLDCLEKNTTKVKNIKAYLLAALYNAPVTMDSYYTAEVNHDLHGRDF